MSVHNSDSEYYYYSDEEREVLPEQRNSAQIKFDRLYRYQRRQREQEEQRQKEKEQHQKEEQEVEKNLRDFVHKFNSRKETSEGTTEDTGHRRTSAGAGIARFRNRTTIDVQEISRETYRKELLAKRIEGHTTPYRQIQASASATGNITSNRSEKKQEEQKLQEQKQQEQKQEDQKQQEQKQEEPASDIMESDIIESDHLSENEEEEASKKEPEPAPAAPAPAAPAPKEPAPEEEDIPMPPPAPEEAIVREEFVQHSLEIMKQVAEKESRRISRAIEKPGEKQRAVAEETLRKRAHEETLKLNETRKPGEPESIAEIELPESPQASPERAPDPDRDRVYTFPPHLDNNAEYIGAIHQHLDYSEDDLYLPRWLSDEQKELLKKYQGTLLHFAIDHLLDEKAELTASDPELVRQRYRRWLYHYRYPVHFVRDYFSVILLLQDGWCPQVRTLEENLSTFTRLCLFDLKPLLEIVREEFLQYCCHSYDLQRQFRRLIMKHLALLNVESHVDDYKFLAKEQHAFQKCYMPLRWDISYSGGKHATLLYSYQAQLLYRAGVIELPHIVRWLKFRARDFALNNRDESVRVESADESVDEYSTDETPNEDDYWYYPDLNPVDPLDEL